MIKHTDEILLPVLNTDSTAKPRYNIRGADGNIIAQNATLELANSIAQEGTAVNKPLLDEFLAASGTTAGTATAYTLAQEGYAFFNGAFVRFQLHAESGANATLNINGTGAKPLKDVLGEAMPDGIPAGAWLTAIYSAAADAYVIAGGGAAKLENLPPDVIKETAEKQFVTAAEKAKWNEGGSGGASVLTRYRLTTATQSIVLDLPSGYNYYRVVVSELQHNNTDGNTVQVRLMPFNGGQHHYGTLVTANSDNSANLKASGSTGNLGRLRTNDDAATMSASLDLFRIGTYIAGQATLQKESDSDDTDNEIGVYGFCVSEGYEFTQIRFGLMSGEFVNAAILVLGVK